MLVCDTVDKGIHAHPFEGQELSPPSVFHCVLRERLCCMYVVRNRRKE